MRHSRMFCLGIAVVLLTGTTAQARVCHGYSEIFSLDTVTAVDDDATGPPQATILFEIYPNPFNPSTTIAYELIEASPIKLEVFDLRGCLVRLVENGLKPHGRHQVAWDGRDNAGLIAAAGIYYCRLCTAHSSMVRSLTLVR